MTPARPTETAEIREALEIALRRHIIGKTQADGRHLIVLSGSIEDALTDLVSNPIAAILAERDAALAGRDEARATNRDLHRRVQKAEGFKARHQGFNYLLNRRLEDRRARRKAEAALDAATAQAERTAGELAAAKAEILALLAPSPAERPCDCEHCYCGNSGDLAAVAAWDAERRLHDAAVAIFDRISRAALTEEPPHAE